MSSDRPVPSREELALCAHDLRGALTVIAGYTALLRRGSLDAEERSAALTGIDATIGRIDALIGDTLAGRLVPRPASESVDVSALAAQAAADARAVFGREVTLDAYPQAIASADPVALARVLENLLSNAAKYAPDGAIEVVVRQEGDRVRVEVADRGPGIPSGERSVVFEPFTRLNSDPDTPGTGLGLTVVRSIVERHGGTVEIADREDGGTVVRVDLPAPR